ncbi:hypothetical protein V5O48_015303, partial [Marasmius crinis-equi]
MYGELLRHKEQWRSATLVLPDVVYLKGYFPLLERLEVHSMDSTCTDARQHRLAHIAPSLNQLVLNQQGNCNSGMMGTLSALSHLHQVVLQGYYLTKLCLLKGHTITASISSLLICCGMDWKGLFQHLTLPQLWELSLHQKDIRELS